MFSYQSLASSIQIWGTIGFIAMFILVLIYALNPRNRDKFDDAARLPLEKD
jgi:cytochrome c oxidase cbb3-type subunit IV